MDSFWHWWQHLPEKMDPVILEIGAFKLQYYGLMYIAAFATTYFLVKYRIGREKEFDVTLDQVQSLITAMIIGLIVGARLGYVLFYNLSYYLAHPLEIILPFSFGNGVSFTGISGMSFHGGLIGTAIATLYACRKMGLRFWRVTDLFVPAIPLGYTFGRLGNFINGELYGRATASPLGMYFPLAPGSQPRHPSQLYEAFFEGIFLFIILWSLRCRPFAPGTFFGLYLIGYGTVRFVIEFFRQPDDHLGFVLFSLSMGQVLCLLMMAAGALLTIYLSKANRV